MEQFATENLILIEFLVDRVNFEYQIRQELEHMQGDICVSFQFLDNVPILICEEDFMPFKPNNEGKRPLKNGKSCLFSLTPEQAESALTQFDVYVQVYKRMKMGLPEKILVGESLISISNLFGELMQAVIVGQTTSAKSLRDCFCLNSTLGDLVGYISVYLRMSCYGKLIVTQFQMNLDDKSAEFKAKEAHYMFKSSKKPTKSPPCRVNSCPYGRNGPSVCQSLGPPPCPKPDPCANFAASTRSQAPAPSAYSNPPPSSAFSNHTPPSTFSNPPQYSAFSKPPASSAFNNPPPPSAFSDPPTPPTWSHPCCASQCAPTSKSTPGPVHFAPEGPTCPPCSPCASPCGPVCRSVQPCPPKCLKATPCPSFKSEPPPTCPRCPLCTCPYPPFPPPSNARAACECNIAQMLNQSIRNEKNRDSFGEVQAQMGFSGQMDVHTHEQNTNPNQPCFPKCGFNPQKIAVRPGCKNAGSPFTFQMSGAKDENVCVNAPTFRTKDGTKFTEISDPDKELFVLRVGKKCQDITKKHNVDLIISTPTPTPPCLEPLMDSKRIQYEGGDLTNDYLENYYGKDKLREMMGRCRDGNASGKESVKEEPKRKASAKGKGKKKK